MAFFVEDPSFPALLSEAVVSQQDTWLNYIQIAKQEKCEFIWLLTMDSLA